MNGIIGSIADWLIKQLTNCGGIWWAMAWLITFHSLAFMPYIGTEAIHITAGPTAIWAMIGAMPLLFMAYTERFSNIGHKPKSRFLPKVYLALLLWNVITTWWIWISTAEGATAAFVLNAFFQLSPWLIFRILQRRTCVEYALLGFAASQILFEWGHANWDLSWSWLNLGNAMAFNLSLAQWYSITGALGGSFWLWTINALLAYGLLARAGLAFPQNTKRLQVVTLSWIILPMLISVGLYVTNGPARYQDLPKAEIVVVQPNVDPYTEKYAGGYEGAWRQLESLCQQSDKAIGPNTKFVLWPETSIPYPIMINEDQTERSEVVHRLRNWLKQHPQIQLIAGINTYWRNPQAPPVNGQPAEPDVYNTALHLSAKGPAELYHKSKLVPGVEQLPYPELLNMLGSLAIDLGGTVGSLGKQPNRTSFSDSTLAAGVSIAPVICYESIYGDFCTGFMRNGGSSIGIITNDAWWGRTNGHRQHWAYASLRAIENRRMIARSANTGISGFINERGDAMQASEYDVQTTMTGQVTQNPDLTIYALLGDWIGWVCVVVLLAIFGNLMWRR